MTNNTRARDPRVEDYVDQCEQHFHDLPPDVQRSLADDVREIVSEVASQLDGNPADLVGEPQAFCAELRAAAGYPPTPSSSTQDSTTTQGSSQHCATQ